MLKAELKKIQKDSANIERDVEGRVEKESEGLSDQLKSIFEQLQRRQERKARTPIEPLTARSRLESKMEVEEVPRASGHFCVVVAGNLV